MATKPKAKAATQAKGASRKNESKAERQYLKIQEEAYYLAEKDAFQKEPIEYWLEAESGIAT